jgi:hypothetical protein
MISYRANLFESLQKQMPVNLGDIVETTATGGYRIVGIVATREGQDISDKNKGEKGYVYIYGFNTKLKEGNGLFLVPISSLKKIPGEQLPTRPKYSPGQTIGNNIKIIAVNYAKDDYSYLCDSSEDGRRWGRCWYDEKEIDQMQLSKKANLFESIKKQIPNVIFGETWIEIIDPKPFNSANMHNSFNNGDVYLVSYHDRENIERGLLYLMGITSRTFSWGEHELTKEQFNKIPKSAYKVIPSPLEYKYKIGQEFNDYELTFKIIALVTGYNGIEHQDYLCEQVGSRETRIYKQEVIDGLMGENQ